MDFDLFVIGAGSGGVRAARMAAQRGARVAVAEMAALGGTCVNVGCIPKKLYSNAAHYGEAFEESRGYGWHFDAPPVFDWQRLKANRAVEITRLNGVYGSLLTAHGVTVLRGRATVTGAHEVTVDGTAGRSTHRAGHLLVATGGHPLTPPVAGAELGVTSDDMFDLAVFPKRLVVIGGGYIACEMASIFHGLGAQVTQAVRGGDVLRGFDADVRAHVGAEMARVGVRQRFQTQVASIARVAGGALHVRLDSGEEIVADTVLHATGRGPNSRGLGLAEAGVELGARGRVVVDAHYQTSVPSIHAIGDVTDRIQLTPVALAEAMVLVDRLFGEGRRRISYEMIPTAVFTHPNVGTVGWTEAHAREALGGGVRIFRSTFKPLRHTLSGSAERTLMKLVVDAETDRVVGLHMVGSDAGEVVQGFAVAMQAGATKAQFDATIGIHPTVAEEFVTMREPIA